MCGVVGRKIDRETGLNSRGDQAPVLDGDRNVAEDGLAVVEGFPVEPGSGCAALPD
jgi:hypothetical protein